MALIILAVSLIVGGILIVFIIRSIAKPLKKLVSTSAKISDGDLTEVIDIKSKMNSGSSAKASMRCRRHSGLSSASSSHPSNMSLLHPKS
ncbi:HAMP domain-containing protein [Bacillus velezensis]|nr:HAMP domain-containing protein [Bacillus velezensis]